MSVDYGLWNALVSTATLVTVAVAAIAAFRQLRHLRAQTSMATLLRVIQDWRDPEMQRLRNYVRLELPNKIAEPGFLEAFDAWPTSVGEHPELELCNWYEQIGAYLKYGMFDEAIFLDVAASPTVATWRRLEPVITRMRRTRGDSMYENFEYLAVRAALFARAHPDGCYPRGTPRMADLVDSPARERQAAPARTTTEESPAPSP